MTSSLISTKLPYVHVSAEEGRKRLLAALLRPGNATSKTGLFALLRRAIGLLRARFSKLGITLRADAGFGEAGVIAFCEQEGIDFVLGLSTNARLKRLVADQALDNQILREAARLNW